MTYRKSVKDAWPESEFVEQEVPMPGGGSQRMRLAVRETRISAAKNSIPVTEVRRLTRERASDGDHHDGAAAGKHRHRQPHVRPLVPGKLLRIHDATL